jgi:hypothetical protein
MNAILYVKKKEKKKLIIHQHVQHFYVGGKGGDYATE